MGSDRIFFNLDPKFGNIRGDSTHSTPSVFPLLSELVDTIYWTHVQILAFKNNGYKGTNSASVRLKVQNNGVFGMPYLRNQMQLDQKNWHNLIISKGEQHT